MGVLDGVRSHEACSDYSYPDYACWYNMFSAILWLFSYTGNSAQPHVEKSIEGENDAPVAAENEGEVPLLSGEALQQMEEINVSF